MLISWEIFLLNAIIVGAISISMIFPTLIIGVLGEDHESFEINLFETGYLLIPFVMVNSIILILVIIGWKKSSKLLQKSLISIRDFEISKRTTFVVIVSMLGIFVILEGPNVMMEEQWIDFQRSKKALDSWTFSDLQNPNLTSIKNSLIHISNIVFQNYRIIPFLASISLAILTYFFTYELTKKRFQSVIALSVLLQSGTFIIFNSSAVYPNFWILFYLFSLYLVLKKPIISPLFFILAIFSKPMIILFFPYSIFFIITSSISQKLKKIVIVEYFVLICAGIVYLITFTNYLGMPFSYHDFWLSINSISYQLRHDVLILLLLPGIVALSLFCKKQVGYVDSIMLLIFGSLISQILVEAFSDISSEPYRFIPLVVFFSIGIGVITSKINQEE